MKRVLILGSGREYKESDSETEYVNLDNNSKLKADIYFDLEDCKNKKISLEDNPQLIKSPGKVVSSQQSPSHT